MVRVEQSKTSFLFVGGGGGFCHFLDFFSRGASERSRRGLLVASVAFELQSARIVHDPSQFGLLVPFFGLDPGS